MVNNASLRQFIQDSVESITTIIETKNCMKFEKKQDRLNFNRSRKGLEKVMRDNILGKIYFNRKHDNSRIIQYSISSIVFLFFFVSKN